MNEIITAGNAVQVIDEAESIAQLLIRFADYIQVKDITAKGYGVCLRCFMQWLYDNGITDPERNDIKAYVKWLASPHPKRTRTAEGQEAPIITFSAGTQATYLRAVKMFFEWTDDENLYPNIAKNIKGATVSKGHKRNAFKEEEVLKILKSIDRSTDTGKRDYAMISLCVYAGMRIIEIQRVNVGNLETLSGENVLYVQHKNRDEADDYHKLPDPVYDAIQEYLKTRKNLTAESPLFAGIGNRNKGRLEEPTISKIIKQRLIAAGFNSRRLTAHSFRHTAITVCAKELDIRAGQQFAGHASPETTCIYIHDDDKRDKYYEQSIYDAINGTKSVSSRMKNVCSDVMQLDKELQESCTAEIEEILNKYKNIQKGVN